MQQGVRSASDLVGPLLKLVKQREQLFFQLLSFVGRNIECSSNDLDSTSVFNRFLPSLRQAHEALSTRERQLLRQVAEEGAAGGASKDIMRLSSRIIELLEASVARVRKGIFDEGGRPSKDFARFKLALHKLLKRQPLPLSEYCENVITFTNSKFLRQLTKLEKYLERVSQGEQVFLRQLYQHFGSDHEVSPEEESKPPPHPPPPSLKKQSLKLNLQMRGEQERKPRRTLKSSLKKREKIQSTRHKAKQENPKDGQSSSQDEGTARHRPTKEQTANRLLKFYALLQLNKKEFLQDYIFEEAQEQKHRVQLLNKLMERNKMINSQINNYVKKSMCFLPVPLIIMPPPNSKSSGDERSDSSPRVQSKTSFLIRERRASFHIQPDHPELVPTLDRSLARPANTSHRRPSQTSQRAPVQKSRKLFVVKQPMVFEDEVIPQASTTQTHWLQAPLSLKKGKNTDNIRLKRKNNPSPMQNAHLPDSFRYPF